MLNSEAYEGGRIMGFMKLRTIGNDGKPGSYFWVRPGKVVGVVTILVPGSISGPNDQVIHMQKAGLVAGGMVFPIDSTPEQLIEKLEKED